MDRMLFPLRMGDRPDDSHIDLSARVDVLPDGAKKLTWPERLIYPGYDSRVFPWMLTPLMDLKVKAGTRGSIAIYLEAAYHYLHKDRSSFHWTGPKWVLDEVDGKV